MQEFLPTLHTSGTFLAFLFGFGFIIFVHELGHFLVAKAVGIKVTQFAIGFGQSLLTFRKGLGFRIGTTEPEYRRRINEQLSQEEKKQLELKEKTATDRQISHAREKEIADQLGLGETEYRLNWIPLGGYVKMLGQEDLGPQAATNDPRSFSASAPWARACVIGAGVTMNLIFAVLFFIIAFKIGVLMPPAVVGPVSPEGPAGTVYAEGHQDDPAYHGLEPGDRVLAIDDESQTDFMQVASEVALASPDGALKFTVQRPGVNTPLIYRIVPDRDVISHLLSVGIDWPRDNMLTIAPATGPLYDAGLRADMRLAAVDGRKTDSYADYYRALVAAQGLPVKVTFVDDHGKEATVPLSAGPVLSPGPDADGQPRNLIGFVPATRVGQVVPDSPAQHAGVRAGDYLAQLGPAIWPSREQTLQITRESHGEPLTLAVFRDGKRIDLPPVSTDRNNHIGVGLQPFSDLTTASPVPSSPAAGLNLTPGSRIVSVEGQPVENWADLQRSLTNAAAKLTTKSGTIRVGYQLNAAGDVKGEGDVALQPENVKQLQDAGWLPNLGDEIEFATLRVPQIAASYWGAVRMGIEKTHHFMLQTYVTLLRVFQGSVPVSELHGPVGIVQIGTKVAHQGGFAFLLFFLGLLSVNLVVMNFLPIPVVDGGLMVFLLIEKLKGSPVSLRVQNAVNYVGLALIFSLFAVTFFYDVARLLH